MTQNVRTAGDFGIPVPLGRLEERLVLGYSGSCDVCGSDNPSRYFRVIYIERVSHECPRCFNHARDRTNEWESEYKFDSS